MYKGSSLYRRGMRVMVYSTRLQSEQGLGWHRGGDSISYTPSPLKRHPKSTHTFHTLSF
jgi:hypothetical protein